MKSSLLHFLPPYSVRNRAPGGSRNLIGEEIVAPEKKNVKYFVSIG